ncbi:hypothetical protein BT69DRAFT_1338812 [Atractiella rhizophila]|nr:hypothetical protein BT69DRAFT_1338812 [Atractiella rhizophila]
MSLPSSCVLYGPKYGHTPLVYNGGLLMPSYAASIHTGTSTGWDDPVLKEKLKRAEFHSVYNGSGELGKRTTNECGGQCTTFCYTGDAGTGPNTGDCADIGGMISVGVYGSQFTTKAGQETSIVKNSCKTFFHNQASDGQDAVYCTADLAAVNNYIANNCAAAQNAHGGICVSGDGRFYIETINSYNQGPFASVNLPFASGKIRGVNLYALSSIPRILFHRLNKRRTVCR